MNVAIATACGRSKREGEWPACELYLSSRIRGICRRASDYGLSPHILSAEYGLVHGDQLPRAYEREMDYGRAQELVSQVAGVMSRFEWFVFFKAGARDAYSQCIRWAAARQYG